MGQNIVNITDQSKKIIVTNNVLDSSVTVGLIETTKINLEKSTTNVVEISSRPGPRGAKGEPGQLTFFEDLTVSGSLFVSGGAGEGNITASKIVATNNISASQGITGSLFGTASHAATASFVLQQDLTVISSSHAVTSSLSFDSLFADEANSASNARTSSFLIGKPNIDVTFFSNDSGPQDSHFTGSFTGSYIGSFIGDLDGTSSHAESSSQAISSSFSVSSSFAETIAPNLGFPHTGNAEITGTLEVTNDIISISDIKANNAVITHNIQAETIDVSDSLVVQQRVTANEFIGDGSSLTGVNTNPFPFTGSANITGSLVITGSFTASAFSLEDAGIPTITSDSNLILTASNAVIVNKVLRLTPTISQSISSPVNGDMIYDSNVNKFLGYANGNWIAFH